MKSFYLIFQSLSREHSKLFPHQPEGMVAAARGLSDTHCPFVLDSEGREQFQSVLSEAFAMAAGAWCFCFSTSKNLPHRVLCIHLVTRRMTVFRDAIKKEKSWCSYCLWTKSWTVVSEHIIHMPMASVSHLNQSEILTYSGNSLNFMPYTLSGTLWVLKECIY